MSAEPRLHWQDYLPFPRVLLLAALLATVLATRFTGSAFYPGAAVRTASLLFVAVALALIAWALWTLDIGMLGGVESLAPRLVVRGPYRWLRHPVYVGMAVALAGYAIAAGSIAGLIVGAVAFLPAALYRATLEERALARRFPEAWPAYRRSTGAVLPRLSR